MMYSLMYSKTTTCFNFFIVYILVINAFKLSSGLIGLRFQV